MHCEHQGKRDKQDEGTGQQGVDAFDEEGPHLGGIADPGVQFPCAPPGEEPGREPEQMCQVCEDEVTVELKAEPQGVADAAQFPHVLFHSARRGPR